MLYITEHIHVVSQLNAYKRKQLIWRFKEIKKQQIWSHLQLIILPQFITSHF